MSAEGRLDFCVHIPFFCGSRLHTLIFTFALPVWEHCARPFFYHYSAPLWYCYARPFCTSAELVSNLKFSTRGSQATGSNVVFLWPMCDNSLEIEGQYHVTPDIFSTCSECLLIFMGRVGSLKLLCQLRTF